MIEGYSAGGFRKDEEARAEGYRGKTAWWVRHGNNIVRVTAPSGPAAIKAALEHWGLEWRRLENYGACTARKCRK